MGLWASIAGLFITYFSFALWHWIDNFTNVILDVVIKAPLYVTSALLSPFLQWWLEESFPTFTFIFWVLAITFALVKDRIERTSGS